MATTDQKLSIIIEAENRTQAALSSVNKSLDSFKSKVDAMQPAFQKMAVAGGIAFTGIVIASTKAVQAYAEVERANRQLEHTIIDVSKGTMEQVKAIDATAQALQQKAGVDADSVKQGAAQLATFKLQAESVVKLTKSMTDLTVNQNGLTASADNYITSANVISKALLGQFGLLERMGIRFSDAQKSAIQFGSEEEKVAAIMEGFNENLRETTDTVGGVDVAMAKFKVTLGDIQENIGKGLNEALGGAVTIIQPILDKISEWTAANPKLVGTIIIVTGAIAGIVAIIGILGVALPAVIAGFELLAGPIGLIVLAVGLLAAGLVYLVTNWQAISAWIEENTGLISDFTALWDYLGQLWTTILLPALQNLWTSLQQLGPLFKFLAEVVGVIFVVSLRILIEVIKVIATVLATIFKIGADLAAAIINWVSNAWQKLADAVQWVIDKVNALIAAFQRLNLVQGAKNVMSSIGDTVSGWFGRASGGSVQPNRSFMVGENGPEMFTPGEHGRITPLGAGMGGIVINITGNSFMGREDIAQQIGDDIITVLKQTIKL